MTYHYSGAYLWATCLNVLNGAPTPIAATYSGAYFMINDFSPPNSWIDLFDVPGFRVARTVMLTRPPVSSDISKSSLRLRVERYLRKSKVGGGMLVSEKECEAMTQTKVFRGTFLIGCTPYFRSTQKFRVRQVHQQADIIRKRLGLIYFGIIA
jgi:hypothetical protein